jgi:lipid-binding SYLF domain-containing protein
MTIHSTTRRGLAVLATGAIAALSAGPALAAKAGDIAADARRARDRLYASKSKARDLGARAKAVLVFPTITKAGALIGGQGGDGALFVGEQVKGFYSIGAASFGLQLGVQTFGYVLFLMTEEVLDDLNSSGGWAVGLAPSLVIVDEGFARTLNTTTLSKDVYAMAFGQKGLMAGSGLEGSKITQIYPDA